MFVSNIILKLNRKFPSCYEYFLDTPTQKFLGGDPSAGSPTDTLLRLLALLAILERIAVQGS